MTKRLSAGRTLAGMTHIHPLHRLLVISIAGMLVAAIASAAVRAEPQVPSTPSLAQAGPFFMAELNAKLHGQWAAAWQTLYSAGPGSRAAPDLRRLRTEHAVHVVAAAGHRRTCQRKPGTGAGRSQPVAGASVAVRVELGWYGNRDPIVLRHVFHLVPEAGRWTWILSQPEYIAYRQGGCAG